MRLFPFGIAVVCFTLACQPGPVVPVPPDADAAPSPPAPEPSPEAAPSACSFPPGACGDACRALAAAGCPNSSPSGLCCSEWLCDLPSWASPSAAAQFKCMAAAKSKATARACGIVCP